MRIKITKSKSGYVFHKADIKLAINSGGGNTKAVVVTFYNDNYKKVTTTEFILPSIDKDLNRLYFETGNHIEGFKISSTGTNSNAPKIRFHIDKVSEWENKIGYFNLLFDSSEKLYYIDLDSKLE